jgi:hypothetical protein
MYVSNVMLCYIMLCYVMLCMYVCVCVLFNTSVCARNSEQKAFGKLSIATLSPPLPQMHMHPVHLNYRCCGVIASRSMDCSPGNYMLYVLMTYGPT